MKRIILDLITIAALFTIMNESLQAQISRRVQVGRFHWTMDAQGASWTSHWLSLGQNGPGLWYDWQAYPDKNNDVGYHGVDITGSSHHDDGHGKELAGQYAYWVGATNWQAPAQGQWGPDGVEAVYQPGITYDIFINDNGPLTINSLINTPTPAFPAPLVFRRIDMPGVTVDGIVQKPLGFDPVGNPFTVDADLVSDARIEAEWTDPIGVTFHEKRWAYSHTDYDMIWICELVVTNTGDCNAALAGLEKEGQTLTDFWLGIKHLLAPEDSDWSEFPIGSQNFHNGRVDWMLDYDEDPAHRYFWAWDGDARDIPGDDQFDPRGGPIGTGNAENPTGEFTTPEVTGLAFIRIQGPDGSVQPNQPATFRYVEFKDIISPVTGKGTMMQAYNWVSGQDGAAMYQQGHGANPYQVLPNTQPHYEPVFGIGPYTLAPNDSIKVAYCFAVGTIPERQAIQYGVEVKSGAIALAQAKQAIYEGGRDDLFAKFELAKDLYLNKNLAAPFLPDPPDNVVITSGPAQVNIKWGPVSGADAYRVYRAIGGVDNGRVYEMIHETTENEYTDSRLTQGQNYFYYVTAIDDGLESSRFMNRVNREAVPTSTPRTEGDWAEQVRVVPNPINIRGNTYQVGDQFNPIAHNSTGFNFDGGIREQRTMLFVNLPEQCTIKIYSSMGDLIKTLEHTSGSGDEKWSPIITDDNLYPASGIYFYTIEATAGPLAGEVTTGKLVIIR